MWPPQLLPHGKHHVELLVDKWPSLHSGTPTLQGVRRGTCIQWQRCLSCVLFADKSAEIKENQEIALERFDDIHDVMVGPVAWYWGIPWPFKSKTEHTE